MQNSTCLGGCVIAHVCVHTFLMFLVSKNKIIKVHECISVEKKVLRGKISRQLLEKRFFISQHLPSFLKLYLPLVSLFFSSCSIHRALRGNHYCGFVVKNFLGPSLHVRIWLQDGFRQKREDAYSPRQHDKSKMRPEERFAPLPQTSWSPA